MVSIQNRIVDRLSDLPDSILHHILSFVDTKSSVQTCILSRRWRSVWKYVDVLTFSQSSFLFDCDFERYVDKVLSLRSDLSRVCKVRTDFGGGNSKHLYVRIMKYAASHGVQELFICPQYLRSFDVVGSVCAYCYQSLKVLELNRVFVEQNVVELWSRLELIESLTLTRCRLDFDDAFANFPRLETLKLDWCFPYSRNGTRVLKVTGSKLLNLEIIVPGFDSLEIVAPKLQSFSLEIGPFCTPTIPDVSSKSNLSSLNRANIKLSGCHEYLDICYSSDNDYHQKKQLLFDWCACLFEILRNARTRALLVETFELLFEICKLVKCQASPFERIKSLSLKHSGKRLGFVHDQVISFFLGGSRDEEDKRFTVDNVCRHEGNLRNSNMLRVVSCRKEI